MSDALIQIVDEQDRPVRAATKQEAWDKGLLHRIVRIMAEAPDGRILLQKRASTMALYPDCWDHSASGHVDTGEDYLTAARRETEEELGVTNPELAEMGRYESRETFEGRKLNRFNKVYRATVSNHEFTLQASEVSGVKWFTLDEIRQLIAEHPDQVTDGIVEVVKKYY